VAKPQGGVVIFGQYLWYFLIAGWIGFTRFAVASEQWKASALFYATSVLLLEWAFGAPFLRAIILAAVVGTASGVHFWALVRYMELGLLWFILLLIGFVGVFGVHSICRGVLLP